jgi:hypothetical protein
MRARIACHCCWLDADTGYFCCISSFFITSVFEHFHSATGTYRHIPVKVPTVQHRDTSDRYILDLMEYLEFTEQSTTQMLDICADLTMTQELRAATVAFLTDRYDDGTYVATADDITELQDATATFLTEHANGDLMSSFLCQFQTP